LARKCDVFRVLRGVRPRCRKTSRRINSSEVRAPARSTCSARQMRAKKAEPDGESDSARVGVRLAGVASQTRRVLAGDAPQGGTGRVLVRAVWFRQAGWVPGLTSGSLGQLAVFASSRGLRLAARTTVIDATTAVLQKEIGVRHNRQRRRTFPRFQPASARGRKRAGSVRFAAIFHVASSQVREWLVEAAGVHLSTTCRREAAEVTIRQTLAITRSPRPSLLTKERR